MKPSATNPFRLLTSPFALDWRNHLIFFILALLTLGFFDLDRLGGDFAPWFVVFASGYAVTVGLIEIGKRLFVHLSTTKRIIYALFLLALTGFVRGLTVFEVGYLLDLVPESEITFRMIGGPLFVLSSYLLSNAVVASILGYRQESLRLFDDLQTLNKSRSSYQSDLGLVNQQQRNRVNDLLQAPMWELQKKLETADNPAKLQDALLTMQSINNEVVRPLSIELSSAAVTAPSVAEIASGGSGYKFSWPKNIKLGEVQPTWLYLSLVIVLGLNSQIAFSSWSQGIVIVSVTIFPIIVLFWLEKETIGKRSLPFRAALAIAVLSGLIASLIGSNLALALGATSNDAFVLQTVSLILVLKISNLLYGVFISGWQSRIDELLEVRHQQEIVNSRLRQQVWLGQKSLAMELHGSVQATLQALALRLAKMQEPKGEELTQILQGVRQALHRIENQEYLAGQDISSLLEELKELWEGTAEISSLVTYRAKEQLLKDQGLARCAFEVIRESVTNAVKHGHASEIEVLIDSAEEELRLTISNNGSWNEPQRQSLGTELLDQLCLEKNLVFENNRFVLRASLALSPEVSAIPAL